MKSLDHIGNLPAIVDNVDKFIMGYENKELSEPLLIDGAYILQRNCRQMSNQGYKVEPLYTESDVYRMLSKTSTYEEDVIHELNEYVSFRLLPNNHIVGATSIELFFKMPSGVTKKIYYSGDTGSFNNQQPFRKKTKTISNANLVITEATYSDLSRGFNAKDIEKERKKMKDDIINELKQGRSILIPAFAQARTQDLLYYLYNTFSNDPNFKTPIFLDGKLSLEINDVYKQILNKEDKDIFEQILSWEKLHFVKDFETSMNLALNKEQQKIVISSAGMCNIGRILNHLKANIEDSNYTIMIIGYCAPTTVGGLLLNDNTKEVKIENMSFKKKAKIIRYNTWSSHIQGKEIIKMMKGINTNLIVIHHSDDSKYKFRDKMEEELRKSNKTTKIICADKDNSIFFI